MLELTFILIFALIAVSVLPWRTEEQQEVSDAVGALLALIASLLVLANIWKS